MSIFCPHLPDVQTPALKRIYTRVRFLNLCHLGLCDQSGAVVKEKGRKRHTLSKVLEMLCHFNNKHTDNTNTGKETE